jgi:hypothetical protein
VDLSGLSVPFVDTANLSGEEESGRPVTGFRNVFFNPFFQIGFQPIEAVLRLDQFFLKFRDPAGMGEITGTDNRNPFFSCPD